MKNIIPSNVIAKWTKPEVQFSLKVSGHTDTVTELCV